ncbi:DUF5677 domain-containing protein [Streptomyces zaomyceticus]|uniref:DUF5677 domain-containing protein n=1 Tax=Streptomyces zaomyceticus TaxID=68286 RepID=UPI002E1C43EB
MTDDEFRRHVEALVAREVRRAPRVFARRWRRRDQFRSGLRRHWGRGLDLYHLTMEFARELGAAINQATPQPRDPLAAVLMQIHARSCRAADEVHCLLEAGHAQGALKPARLLYELAVVAYVLGEYGRLPEHADLVDRYVAHHDVVAYKSMETYQRHAETLGQHPFTADEMMLAKEVSNEAKAKHGNSIGRQFGWADPLPGDPKQKSTQDLAKLAGIAHLHPYFEWASAETHAGAQGIAMNTVSTRRGAVLRAGPGVDGIAEPASLALLCLYHCTVALAAYGSSHCGEEVLMHIQVVERLRARTDTALGIAHMKASARPLIATN